MLVVRLGRCSRQTKNNTKVKNRTLHNKQNIKQSVQDTKKNKQKRANCFTNTREEFLPKSKFDENNKIEV